MQKILLACLIAQLAVGCQNQPTQPEVSPEIRRAQYSLPAPLPGEVIDTIISPTNDTLSVPFTPSQLAVLVAQAFADPEVQLAAGLLEQDDFSYHSACGWHYSARVPVGITAQGDTLWDYKTILSQLFLTFDPPPDSVNIMEANIMYAFKDTTTAVAAGVFYDSGDPAEPIHVNTIYETESSERIKFWQCWVATVSGGCLTCVIACIAGGPTYPACVALCCAAVGVGGWVTCALIKWFDGLGG